MAQTLDNISFSASLAATLNNQLALTKVSAPLAYTKSFAWATGNLASQADRIYSAQRTIAASGNDDLDMAGVLVDPIGTTITFARIKFILVFAAAANTNNVVMGGGASNPVSTILGGTTPSLAVRPGGMLMLTAPDATGYAVTASTADILRFTNSGAGTAVTYDLILMGSSV